MNSGKITSFHKKYLFDFGLTDMDFEELFIQNYRKGEFLCEQGYPMEYLLFIIEGKVKVCSLAANGKTLLFCFNLPGSMLGEVELMTNSAASSSVCAVTDVKCIAVPLEKYRSYLLGNLAFMNRISRIMAEIIARSSINDASNILYPFESRLCAYIAMTHENGSFNENLTELAEFLGISYRHLLRTLDKLCTKNILEKTTHEYMIKDHLKLNAIGNNYYSR